MNIFASTIRDIRESKEGRIRRVPGHWILVPDETRRDGTYPDDSEYVMNKFVRISTDKQGRKMQLVARRAVHCPNPEYADSYASLKEGVTCLSIPESVCKNCEHYRSARKSRRRYATCGFAAVENPVTETWKDFSLLLSKAAKTTNELMGN